MGRTSIPILPIPSIDVSPRYATRANFCTLAPSSVSPTYRSPFESIATACPAIMSPGVSELMPQPPSHCPVGVRIFTPAGCDSAFDAGWSGPKPLVEAQIRNEHIAVRPLHDVVRPVDAAPLAQVLSVRREYLYAAILPVHHIDKALGADANAVCGMRNCPGPSPGSPHDFISSPVAVKWWMRALP